MWEAHGSNVLHTETSKWHTSGNADDKQVGHARHHLCLHSLPRGHCSCTMLIPIQPCMVASNVSAESNSVNRHSGCCYARQERHNAEATMHMLCTRRARRTSRLMLLMEPTQTSAMSGYLRARSFTCTMVSAVTKYFPMSRNPNSRSTRPGTSCTYGQTSLLTLMAMQQSAEETARTATKL